MGARGIADRVRQEVQKRADSLLAKSGYHFSERSRGAAGSGRFFFAAEDVPARIAALKSEMPDVAAEIIRRADAAMRHEFDLLGYGSLQYGAEVDWHLDAVSGKRAPLVAWHKVPYLDENRVGDAKVTAELNRHQHLPVLAKAYLLTGDRHYIAEVIAQFEGWQRDNPYPKGINWASSLEVAFRSLSWIWVLELLQSEAEMAAARDGWVDALALNARQIETYLSTTFSPNTHLLGEATALFFIGTIFRGLPSAQRWRKKGWGLLLEHARDKVLADGAYYELSTHYHVYAMDFFLHARQLALRNEIAIPPKFDETLRRMYTWLAQLCGEGEPPRLGDDDGGRVYDASRNEGRHLRDPLFLCALALNTPLPQGNSATEEALWLYGPEASKNTLALQRASSKSEHESWAAVDSGIYILRSGPLQVVADAGGSGGERGGHGHADALSITASVDGTPMLIDAGTGSYVGAARDRFRTTPAHNTAVVDARSQAEPSGLFAWKSQPRTRVLAWRTEGTNAVWIAQCEHAKEAADGHDKRPMHQRCVFADPGLMVVRDSFLGAGAHTVKINWLLSPETSVQMTDGDLTFKNGERDLIGQQRYHSKSEKRFSLHVSPREMFFSSDRGSGAECPMPDSARCGFQIADAEYSPAYGRIETTRCLRLESRLQFPAEVVQIISVTEAIIRCVQSNFDSVSVYRIDQAQSFAYIFFGNDKPWNFTLAESGFEFSGRCRIAYARFQPAGELIGTFSDGEFTAAPRCAGAPGAATPATVTAGGPR